MNAMETRRWRKDESHKVTESAKETGFRLSPLDFAACVLIGSSLWDCLSLPAPQRLPWATLLLMGLMISMRLNEVLSKLNRLSGLADQPQGERSDGSLKQRNWRMTDLDGD
jgi:hypothetical protein